MFVKCFAGAIVGIRAVGVTVEVKSQAAAGLYLVGRRQCVKESEQRIRAAFENSSRRMTGKKVVVNLAPADLRKEGSGFDLAYCRRDSRGDGARSRRRCSPYDVRRANCRLTAA